MLGERPTLGGGRMFEVNRVLSLQKLPYSRAAAIIRWSTQRIVFGKPLTSQAVIRAKLASMISRVEACQNWLESVTYQMNNVRSSFLPFDSGP